MMWDVCLLQKQNDANEAHRCSLDAAQHDFKGQINCMEAQKGQKVPRLRL